MLFDNLLKNKYKIIANSINVQKSSSYTWRKVMRKLSIILILSFMTACGGSSDGTTSEVLSIPGIGTPAKVSAVPAL